MKKRTRRPVLVVPLESSPDMKRTIGAATTLATRLGATVDLLRIRGQRRPSYVDQFPRAAATARGEHESVSAEHDSAVSGRVRTVTRLGKPHEVIAAYALLTRAALIVVGRNYGTRRLFRSSRFVSTLSRSAPAPVLILPLHFAPDSDTLSFRRIVSAFDFTVASAVAIRTVLGMKRRNDRHLTLVHALTSRRQMVFSGGEALKVIEALDGEAATMTQRLWRVIPPDAAMPVDARVKAGAPHRAILAVASEIEADLIVMGVAPRARLDEVVFGSTLRQVVRLARVPVLVVSVPFGAHALEETADVRGGARRR